MPESETSHEQDAEGGLGVVYTPIPDKCECFREGLGRNLDKLVRLASVLAGREVRRPKQVNLLVRKPGCCPYRSKTLHPPGVHTDFLKQLPLRTILRVLSRIQPPRRYLDQRPVRRIAVLLDEQDRGICAARIRREREHGRSARMTNHFQLPCRSVRKTDRIHVQVYDPAFVDSFTGELHQLSLLALKQPGDGNFEAFGEEIPRVAADVGMDRRAGGG